MGDRRNTSTLVAVALWGCWLIVLAAFVALAVWCDGRYFLPFDIRPTIWIQKLHRYQVAGPLFHAVNFFGGYGLIAVGIVSAAALLWRRLYVEAALLAGAGAMRLLQLGVRHIVERPFSPEHPPEPDYYPGSNSFPSGHVVGEVIVFTLLFAFAPRIVRFAPAVWLIRAVCVFMIATGGVARIYAGAHWPSDVIGGVMLALLYVIPALWIDARMRRRSDRMETPLPAERPAFLRS